MKRIFATCLLAVAVALGASAQNAGDVLNKTIAVNAHTKTPMLNLIFVYTKE